MLTFVTLAAAAAAAVAAPAAAKELALPCTVCEFVVGYVEGYVKANPDATLMELEDLVKKNVCAHLGSFAPECELLVDSELPAIVDALKTAPPAEVCAKVHLCQATAAAAPLVSLPKEVPCDVCHAVVAGAESYLREHADAAQAAVAAELNKVCDALGATVAAVCHDLVAQQLPAIVDALSHLSADQVCGELRLCGAATRAVAAAVAAEVRLSSTDVPCDVCHVVVGGAESYLRDHKDAAQDAVAAELNKMCDAFGTTLGAACRDLVAQQLPRIIDALDHTPAEEVCAKLGLCKAAAAAQAVKPAAIGCTACKFVVDEIDDMLKKNQTQQQIEAEADRLCDALGPYADECKAWLDMEIPIIIKYLAHMSPANVCAQLHLCAAAARYTPAVALVRPAVKLLKPQQPKLTPAVALVKPAAKFAAAAAAVADNSFADFIKPAALPCTVCEFVVQYVETIVAKNPDATLQEIEKLVKDKVCAHLGLLASECDSLVDHELPAILDAIKNAPADQVCKKVHLCH